MPTVAPGFTLDWLAARRDELNGRFRAASRRSAALDPAAVLELAAELLPALGGAGEPGADDLLSSAWDLILLHAGRGTLAPRGGSSPGIALLLRKTFPALRPLLLAGPRQLPAALSNAVENLGPRGAGFAGILPAVAASLDTPEALLDAASLLAWRLGEARLRPEALGVAESLPAGSVLAALGLEGWPAEGAALAIAALRADAWRRPEEPVSEGTLAKLPKAPPRKLEEWRASLLEAPQSPLDAWVPAGAVGGFSGFDGAFDDPPLLLAAPGVNRHRFWALAGNGAFRVDADAYGWRCRPDPSAAEFKVGELRGRGFLASLLGPGDDGSPRLSADGTLTGGGESAKFPGAAGASSFVAGGDFVAWTTPDSHRIRLRLARGGAV